MNYVVIMPAYNEAEFVGRTLDSLCGQTLLPLKLIVVDDGSSDATPEIVQKYAEEYSWIQLVQKEKSERAVGSKVVLAFNAGYGSIPPELDYDFIVKLDADLELPSDYFEQVASMFETHDDCGICGGYCMIPEGDGWIKEKTAPMHVRGAFKAVRRTAFDEIGGFRPIMGWDGVDQTKLLFNGWKFGLLDLPVKHFRPTGDASNAKELCIKMGESRYLCGYDFFLTGLASLKTAIRRGNIAVFQWILQGYFYALFGTQSRHLSKEEVMFLRKVQYMRILSEKSVLKKYAYISV